MLREEHQLSENEEDFMQACRDANVEEIRRFVKLNPDLLNMNGIPKGCGWVTSPLSHLVYYRDNIENRLQSCEYLVKHGADVNYVNSLGNSVLMVALSANHGTPIIAILRCLVAAGADLSKTGGRLISVIWQAARRSKLIRVLIGNSLMDKTRQLDTLLARGADTEMFWRNMLALVTLGFSKMVEESLSKMNSNLLNEGLIKTCGDAWWDDGRFDHERIILCEILLRLGAVVSCKNQFQKTPVEIARCWNRQDLAKFLENPESMMDKIPVTPNMLHAQRTSTPNSVINGISTRTQKLIQKKEREGVHSALIQNRGPIIVSNAANGYAIPNMGYLAHNKPADPPEPVTPQFGRTSISPSWERRDSFNSLPADLHSGQTVKEIEMKNLSATNKEKPLVTKGVPLKFKVPRCQLQLKISNPSYCHPSDENRALSAPASPTKYQSMHDFLTNGNQKQKRTQVGTPGLSPTSASYHGPIIRGQNRIEMKIGQPRPTADKIFTPTAPLKNYNLNGISSSSPHLNQPPQRVVELLTNQVKYLQQQKSSVEFSMMELKNEITDERHRHQLQLEQMRTEMRQMQEQHQREKQELERQNFVIQKKLEQKDSAIADIRSVLSEQDNFEVDYHF